MNHETMLLLEKQFDTAFAAPDGIQKLRELILTLAMQGKLLPQDPNDQPASELLEEIEVEKQRLVKEGKIKQSKPLPDIKQDEIPYNLPKNWEWVRLGEIVSLLGDGLHGTPTYDETGNHFFINGNNLSDGVIEIKENTRKVSTHEYQKYKKKLNSRTVLVSINGTIGNVAFYNNENVILGKSACYFNLFKQIDKEFTKKLLNSPYFLEYALSSATGTTIKNVSLKAMREFLFPLPPLAEQHRIVAKIDRLMARCDDLEKLRTERNQKRITVHTAALDRLLNAKESNDFSTAWHFITQHFGELYSVKENVAELRKAILQLAVMGKLVPQDPTDEPASELLRAIAAEKQQLIKEGKIKQPKPLPDIKPNEAPYKLPQGWEWANLESLFALITDGDHQAPPKADIGVPFLVIGNLNKGKVNLDNCRFVSHAYYESLDWGRKPLKNDILYTVTGSYGIPVFIDSNYVFCVQRHVAIFKSVESSPIKYLTHLLKSEYALKYATSVATGIAQKTVPLTGLRRMPIVVPPLQEQHRIVAKIDRLMTLCDALAQQIEAATSKQADLLNAVMAQV